MMINLVQRLLWQDRQTSQLPSAKIPIPKLYTLAGIILVSIFTAAAAVLGTVRLTGFPVDPFDAYADILPGQPWANAEAHGFDCNSNDEGSHYTEACSLLPENSIFSRVSVE
jgi:hypothetical protein